jgi:hypothetical protein
MDDSKTFLRAETDEKTKVTTLTHAREKGEKDVLQLTRPDDEHFVLEGKLGDEPVVAKLKKLPLPQFQLVTRGFHWIQEFPYNR